MLLFCCSNTSSIFPSCLVSLHALAWVLISVHLCLLGSSTAARCFSLSISRPTHPVQLLPALSRYLPSSLIPPILNLHCTPARVTFVGLHWLSCSTSRWCGLPPSYFISPALLHLLSGAPLAKRLQHHNPSFSVLRTFCLTVAVVRRRLGRASSSLSVVCRRLF